MIFVLHPTRLASPPSDSASAESPQSPRGLGMGLDKCNVFARRVRERWGATESTYRRISVRSRDRRFITKPARCFGIPLRLRLRNSRAARANFQIVPRTSYKTADGCKAGWPNVPAFARRVKERWGATEATYMSWAAELNYRQS